MADMQSATNEESEDTYPFYPATPINWLYSRRSADEVKKYFLLPGKDVNKEEVSFGLTPLLLACLKRNPTLVKVLIEIGADVNRRNKDGATALFMVIGIRRSPKIMKLLLQNGAHLDERCITCLLSHGAKKTLKNKMVLIALEYIRKIEETKIEVIKALIHHCATLRFEQGRLILHRSLQDPTYTWSKHIETIVNVTPAAVIEKDPVTGLYPFQLAIVNNDLDSCFELLCRTPNFLQDHRRGYF
jgi:ankyrin repeat protein